MSRAVRRKKSGNSNSQAGSGGGGGGGGGKRTKTIDLGWTRNNKKRGDDNDDDHIDSDSELEGRKEPSLEDENHRIEEEETLDAKKVRLAREYLRKLEADDDDDDSKSGSGSGASSSDEEEDEAEGAHERIGIKLQRERLKREGMLERALADRMDQHITRMTTTLRQGKGTSASAPATTEQQQQQDDAKDWIESGHVQLLKGHDLTPTCVALQANGERAISASKDHSVIVWDVERGQCAITLADTWKKQASSSGTSAKKNHDRTMGEVLSVACSDDGRYAAIGKRDATVCIYDIRAGGSEKNKLIKTFTGHKGPVTCLAFRTQSLQLFSGSDDRCIR
jgi:ribosomal RNA-processing protein 9